MKLEAKDRIVVMTGGTGGFGARTLAHLAKQTDLRVFVGARGGEMPVPASAVELPLDLASLENVRCFAADLIERLGGELIDVLILNAGVHLGTTDRVSADGFELSFAVNHLSHYLLVRLLLPHMAQDSRILLTTSDTHDPAVSPAAPKSLDLRAWTHPAAGGLGTGVRAYSASKLCNLMTAITLSERPEVTDRKIRVVAFSPGLTAGASGRDSSPVLRVVVQALIRTVFPVIGLFKPEFAPNSPEHSGKMLFDIATGNVVLKEGSIYLTLIKGKIEYPAPSELARNAQEQDLLWRESAAMVGLA